MGILDSEAEAIEKDILATWAEELSPEQLRQVPAGQALVKQSEEKGIEKGIEKVAVKMMQAAVSTSGHCSLFISRYKTDAFVRV